MDINFIGVAHLCNLSETIKCIRRLVISVSVCPRRSTTRIPDGSKSTENALRPKFNYQIYYCVRNNEKKKFHLHLM